MGSGSDWPRLAAVQQDLPQRFPAHVFHNDVSGRLAGPPVGVLHEVVDTDDARVLDLGEEPAFGDGRLLGRRVSGVEQALEHDPPVAEVVVHGQVDPAEPAVGEAAEHLVLARDQLAGCQPRRERERVAAVGAEPLDEPRLPVPAAADGPVARAAEPLALRYLRVLQHRGRRVPGRYRGDVHQPRAQMPPRRPDAARAGPAAAGPAGAAGPARGRRARRPMTCLARPRRAPGPCRRCRSTRPGSSRRSQGAGTWPARPLAPAQRRPQPPAVPGPARTCRSTLRRLSRRSRAAHI